MKIKFKKTSQRFEPPSFECKTKDGRFAQIYKLEDCYKILLCTKATIGFKWVTIKKKFDDYESAKKYIIDNFDEITKQFELHFIKE